MHRDNEVYKQLSKELLYLYNTGKCYNAYRNFGAHVVDGGVQFTVWAPGVRSVRVAGDFNGWGQGSQLVDDKGNLVPDKDFYLELLGDTGVYTGFIPYIGYGTRYKYDIEFKNGKHVLKADPFGFESEPRPRTASVVCDLSYKWHDSKWLKKRETADGINGPMNIYEVHLGSWKRHPVGSEKRPNAEEYDGFYSYDELAESLVPYVKEMGYNYIEILPAMEHPLDASWGYQVVGYYAASSRSGHPTGLMHLIDQCHKEGIGVIIDWVPGHFCPDEQGLANFNGGFLYESEIHPDWGTYKFDFGRSEVRSFLLSNANFWIEKYHVDGIRVDGVSSMLYLNFGVSDPARKKFNKYGDEGNLEAIDFLKEFNRMVGIEHPGVLTCAEESSAWPLVTAPPDAGGLGFHFKWNMGWMNDTLDFMSTDFIYRGYDHNKLTFSMTYAFSENYILPFSHDEVVHGKHSLIGRMPGTTEQQFAGIRLLAMYQMTHPGKKLNFMGHEIAQFIEWREYEELEWFMLGYENHAKYQEFIKELNHIYLKHKALWEIDTSWAGFDWIDPSNNEQNVLSFLRYSVDHSNDDEDKAKKETKKVKPQEVLLSVLNFNVQEIDTFRIGVPSPGKYKEIINSSAPEFGGDGRVNKKAIRAENIPMHGRDWSIEIKMPVLGGAIFQWVPDKNKK